jgi:hypothetical protein
MCWLRGKGSKLLDKADGLSDVYLVLLIVPCKTDRERERVCVCVCVSVSVSESV